jgi:hypothetical protein
VLAPSPSLAAVAALTALQHLHLHLLNVSSSPGSGSTDSAAEQVPASLLLHLPNLTHLSFKQSVGWEVQGYLKHLSTLAKLQELHCDAWPHGHCYSSMCLGPSSTPDLSSLSALSRIRLSWCSLDPAALLGCTQLCSLELAWVSTVSENAEGDTGGMLLSCIGSMPRLRHLELRLLDFNWPEDLATYSSLTASSNLQHLQLSGMSLPGGGWQKMFPKGKTWPSLQVGGYQRIVRSICA